MKVEEVREFCAPGKMIAKKLFLDRERLTALCKPGEYDALQFYAHRINETGMVEGTIHNVYNDYYVTVDPARLARDLTSRHNC